MQRYYTIYQRNDFHRNLDSRHIQGRDCETLEQAKTIANGEALSTPPMKRGGLEPMPATFCVDEVYFPGNGRSYIHPRVFVTTL